MKRQKDEDKVPVGQESHKKDVAVAAKRSADGKALPKQRREKSMDVDAILKKALANLPLMMYPSQGRRTRELVRSRIGNTVDSTTMSGCIT